MKKQCKIAEMLTMLTISVESTILFNSFRTTLPRILSCTRSDPNVSTDAKHSITKMPFPNQKQHMKAAPCKLGMLIP